MNDLISRQAVIEINQSYHGQMPNEVNHRIWKEINELPSAQPEIIHCGNCKYYTPVTAHCEIRGKGLYLIRGMEDFCSRAERRTDDRQM